MQGSVLDVLTIQKAECLSLLSSNSQYELNSHVGIAELWGQLVSTIQSYYTMGVLGRSFILRGRWWNTMEVALNLGSEPNFGMQNNEEGVTIWRSISTLRYMPKRTCLHKTWTWTFIAAFFITAGKWKQPKWPINYRVNKTKYPIKGTDPWYNLNKP